MIKDVKINKPEPLKSPKEVTIYTRSADVKATLRDLEEGKSVLISEFYSNGLVLLKEIHMYLKRRMPGKTFKEQRAMRAAYHKLSNQVLIEVVDHELDVKKAPSIGWFKKLYPETPDFLLTFPQVQGYNSSWQWYKNGIVIPVLRNKVHPYYGVYFPTRFEHLILFDNWLKRYEGPKKSAIDVGVGSGVLSFQMVKYGFQKVFATDTNPNAIVGLSEAMGDTKMSRKITLDHGHLFGQWEKPTELIVFNPPWLPQTSDNDTGDTAIYYNNDLFAEFFAEAKKRLLPEGELVVLFSNIAQITEVSAEHPIEKEIAQGGRFQLERCFKKRVKGASELTKRDQNWRGDEEVELWVLRHK